MKPRPATIVRRFLEGWTIERLAETCTRLPYVTAYRYVENAIRDSLNRKRSKRS